METPGTASLGKSARAADPGAVCSAPLFVLLEQLGILRAVAMCCACSQAAMIVIARRAAQHKAHHALTAWCELTLNNLQEPHAHQGQDQPEVNMSTLHCEDFSVRPWTCLGPHARKHKVGIAHLGCSIPQTSGSLIFGAVALHRVVMTWNG